MQRERAAAEFSQCKRRKSYLRTAETSWASTILIQHWALVHLETRRQQSAIAADSYTSSDILSMQTCHGHISILSQRQWEHISALYCISKWCLVGDCWSHWTCTELKTRQKMARWMDVLNSVFKCALRGIERLNGGWGRLPVRVIDARVAIELGLGLVCILLGISGGFAAAEQKLLLMPNCWQRKDQCCCSAGALLFLLHGLGPSQMYSRYKDSPAWLWLKQNSLSVLAVYCSLLLLYLL